MVVAYGYFPRISLRGVFDRLDGRFLSHDSVQETVSAVLWVLSWLHTRSAAALALGFSWF